VNGRINELATPEERIAAVAQSLCVQMRDKEKREPDYADFRDVLRPFIQKEILIARIAEARTTAGIQLTERMRALANEILNIVFPDLHDLRGRR
jgi:hypothetical protein